MKYSIPLSNPSFETSSSTKRKSKNENEDFTFSKYYAMVSLPICCSSAIITDMAINICSSFQMMMEKIEEGKQKEMQRKGKIIGLQMFQ